MLNRAGMDTELKYLLEKYRGRDRESYGFFPNESHFYRSIFSNPISKLLNLPIRSDHIFVRSDQI